MLLLAVSVEAQQVASKDLLRPTVVTTPPVAAEGKPDYPKGCEKMGVGIADGMTLPEPPREIRVALVKLSNAKLTIGDEFTATVKLENAGRGSIAIPWSTDFQATLDGQDPDNRTWEFGEFQIALRNAEDRYDELVNTSLPLYGSKSVPGSILTIKAGEWITAQISFRVAVVNPEFEKVEEGAADLTLEWFQTVRTFVVKGCGVTRGFFPYDGFYAHKNRVAVQRVEIIGSEKTPKGPANSSFVVDRPDNRIIEDVGTTRSCLDLVQLRISSHPQGKNSNNSQFRGKY